MCGFEALIAVGSAMYSASQKNKQEWRQKWDTKIAADQMAAERSKQIKQQSEMMLQRRLSTGVKEQSDVASMTSDSGLAGLSISQLFANASLVTNQDVDVLKINRDNALKDTEIKRQNSLITVDNSVSPFATGLVVATDRYGKFEERKYNESRVTK